MSIARGVVPRPGIMIFDDSTAAIDAVTEKKVREALAEATETQATIIIAHRLSSLMHADEILVLDEGRVVERGTHPELIAAGGTYADLYALQTRSDAAATLDEAAADDRPRAGARA
jgi:ATP-binding cassette subfamily B protein